MKRILPMILFILLLSRVNSEVIYTTTLGGFWNDTTTWIGNKVPTANDDVIIQASVFIGYYGEKTCNNLTINFGCGLSNDSLQGGSTGTYITVFGDLINHGVLYENENQGLNVYIGGNISNYGTWNVGYTILTGQDQHLASDEGWIFYTRFSIQNPATNLILDSDLIFGSPGEIDLNSGASIYLNDHKITTCHIHDGNIFSSEKLVVQGILTLSRVFVYGDLTLEGTIRKNSGVVFKNNITITDTLRDADYATSVHFESGITNLGVMMAAHCFADGNINNNGVWITNTHVPADHDQQVTFWNDNYIAAPLYLYAGFVGYEYLWYKDNVFVQSGEVVTISTPSQEICGEWLCKTVAAPGDTSFRMITITGGSTTEISESSDYTDKTARVIIAPNPCAEYLRCLVELDRPSEIVLKITDAKGKIVFSENAGLMPAGVNETVLHTESLAPGAYFVIIISKDGESHGKFIRL